MFSSRLPSEPDPNSFARFAEKVRESGAEILDLTEGNPTQAGIAYPGEMLAGLSDPRSLVYQPEAFGLPEARASIADLQGVSPERVILTASTSEAYSWIFKLLCDPGDEVLVPSPSYPLFELLASLEAVAVKNYQLHYCGGWHLDLSSVQRQITPRTKALVIVNPNNPTGSYLKTGERNELTALCAERGIAILSDEVFSDYQLSADPDRVKTMTRDEHPALSFSLNGLSKMVGLPQMKLGWMILSGPQKVVEAARGRLELIADTYLSVGAPVQHGLRELLAGRESVQRQILARLSRNLAWLQQRTRTSSVSVLAVEGGWYATLRIPGVLSEDEWIRRFLVETGVLVQPGYFYDFKAGAYLILSLLTPESRFEDGVNRVVNLIERDS